MAIKNALPRARKEEMCSTKVWTEFSSRPSEGSSRMQIRFSDPYAGMSPCNTAKRRYKPPERWHTRSCFLCCKFHAVSRLSGSEIPPQFAANSILSPTSSSPLIPPDCRVNPNGFARLMEPDWRGMIPAIDSINVDFPEPFSPVRMTQSPESTFN